MANFKLGAIFTDVAGSVGGTTFRRTPRGIIGYNKQGRQIKSAYAKNNVRGKLAKVFSSWGSLSQDTKESWNAKALLYPQLNKFGDTVVLTGRQFYTKLNCQLIATDTTADLNNWVDTIPPFIADSIATEWSFDSFAISTDNPPEECFMLVQVYPLTHGGNPKPTAHFFNTAIVYNSNNTRNEIGTEVKNQYPWLRVGDVVGVNIYFMSVSGFKSAVQVFRVILES
jgi:hypothetical protein